jgi:uncharacterized protein YraI
MLHRTGAIANRIITLALLAGMALTALAGAAAAGALVYGTAAWTNTELTLHEGPGVIYDTIGTVPGEIRIRVERCSDRWCQIRSETNAFGWVSRDDLNFGQDPGYVGHGPELNYPAGGPGTICVFSGENFTGSSACSSTGFVVPDLLLYGIDNSINSVQVDGNVSVMLCRDRDFSSYCERIIESAPSLNRFLSHNVSSYRVY